MDSMIILLVIIVICLALYRSVNKFVEFIWAKIFSKKININATEIEAMYKQQQEVMHVYREHQIGDKELTPYQKELILKNRNLLLDNNIPITKIRFIFHPTFTYDIDTDTINPKYNIMLPIDQKTDMFLNELPIVEINKPKNIMGISVRSYSFDDNFAFIREIVKSTKKGIVIMLGDQEEGKTINPDYFFGVDTAELRMVMLDNEIEIYNNLKK